MWFISFLAFSGVLWLLWIIGKNTGEFLERQKDIHRELIQLNQRLSSMGKDEVLPSTFRADEGTLVELDQSISKVNINTADMATLQSLNGIGKAVAQKIIDARPFNDVGELIEVSGIGEDLLNKIKFQLTI